MKESGVVTTPRSIPSSATRTSSCASTQNLKKILTCCQRFTYHSDDRLGFTGEGTTPLPSMKKKSTSKSAFSNFRVLIASVLCLFGVFVALVGSGAFAQNKGTRASQQPARSNPRQDAPGTQTPDVVQMVGPVRLDQDL